MISAHGRPDTLEPLRSLLPQIRTHFNTALLNIAALRPHLCVCHSCFKALKFPPLSLFSAFGFKLRCLNGPRLVNSFNSFAMSTGRAVETAHSKFSYTALFECYKFFFILHGYFGDDQQIQRHWEAVLKIYQAQMWFMQVVVQSGPVLACILFCSFNTFPFKASSCSLPTAR